MNRGICNRCEKIVICIKSVLCGFFQPEGDVACQTKQDKILFSGPGDYHENRYEVS